MSAGNFCQRTANPLKSAAKTFTTVAGHQDHFFVGIQERITLCQAVMQCRITHHPIAYPEQRVNHRVTGDEDMIVR
ncbi:hypothetical protein D3C75_1296150 [compost metagenome]